MTYRIQGTLKLPDGAPAANCEVEFVSRKNFSPLVQGAKTNILTSATGAYDVTLELGEYAVILYTGGTYPAQAGTITLSVDTTPGLDLPSLLNRSEWVPATPEYMQQIEAWLVSAGEYAASAEASAQSAEESAASIAGAISAHEAKAGAHSIAGVSGLQQALDGKEVAGSAASAISTHKTESDAHTIETITGLRGELDSLAGWSGSSAVVSREALRRSYAEAGFTLVDGSFEEGGTLTSANDVLLHKASGIAYSGPSGHVAAGTDPSAAGSGCVPRADVLLRDALAAPAGSRLIGACPDVATLRTIEPITNGQRIPVIGYLSSHPLRGGSDWYADTSDITSADNGVDCIVTTGGKRWRRRNVAFISLADCGLVGDGVVDDTAGFNRAIYYSQTKDRVVYGIAGDNYKTTGPLQLVNQTTNVSAKIHGAGRNVCTITPVGTFDAVRAWGLGWGGSGQGAAFEVQFGGFLLAGSSLTGNLLDIRRVGLWSKFFDIRGTNNNGVGMYLQSVFDHEYHDIEMRNCAGLGIQVYESKASDPDGFQECSFLTFDRVHAINCNGKTIQWQCRGGDCYTFTQCKPSEGEVGIDFIQGSAGHTLVGTYVDGQANHQFDNVGIRFGADCFGNSVLGGRYWNTKYAVDFVGGGRSSVSATNVVYDSPMGASVFDVRLQAGVQQPVSVASGLSVADESNKMLRVPRLPATYGVWTPAIIFDSGLSGGFTYTLQRGEWWLDGNMLFVRATIQWSGKPSAGAGAGVALPMSIKLGPSHLAVRFKPGQMDVTGFQFLGHFQNNGVANKLYIYADAVSSGAASAGDFASSGNLIFQATLPIA